MKPKVLIVDAQLWQTNAWYRGMGIYTRSLLRQFGSDNDFKIVLVFNKNLPMPQDKAEAINNQFSDLDSVFLDLPTGAFDEATAKQKLDEFITANNYQKAELHYLMLSLFMFDFCSVFPSFGQKLLIIYDIIPLLYWSEFNNYFPPALYLRRFSAFYAADKVITISETSARDISHYIGIDADRIYNIDGAATKYEGPVDESIIGKLGLESENYVLLPTGAFPHKNTQRAIEAFANFNEVSSRKMRLVATSFFTDQEKKEAELICDSIVFTGSVTDMDMSALYKECASVLMPSYYEGLGIPVLEGIMYDKPVACSQIDVFAELPNYQEALYVFDPNSVDSIYNAIFSSVAKADYQVKRKRYQEIVNKYNWARCAKLLAGAIDVAAKELPSARSISRKDIAIVCPDPRYGGSLGRFTQALLGYASGHAIKLTYFIDSGGGSPDDQQIYPDFVRYVATDVYDINDFLVENTAHKYDAIIYFLSSEPRFSDVYHKALMYPGNTYIDSANYSFVISDLMRRGKISNEQYEMEKHLQDTPDYKDFKGVTVLASAKTILMPRKVAKNVQSAVKKLQIKTAPLELDIESDTSPADLFNSISLADRKK